MTQTSLDVRVAQTSPYHAGELLVQARAGTRALAEHVGEIVRPTLPPRSALWLARQQLVVVGGADAEGRLWASLLTGAPGLLDVVAPNRLRVAALPADGDPLRARLRAPGETREPVAIGILAIDFATRRRLRVNGRVARTEGDGFVVQVDEAYPNCPKYIQQRLVDPVATEAAPPSGVASWSDQGRLTDRQRAMVAGADTCFIATAHPDRGADVSHRGGSPGFVRVDAAAGGGDALVLPDYGGNGMFNTFGNLAVRPEAGLLFLDFDTGTTLQLAGRATVLWERAAYAGFPGAERAVRFDVAEVVEQPNATRLRWRLVERSPFNPPAP